MSASFFNGEIHAIKPEIVEDILDLADFAEGEGCKLKAVQRVKDYLDAYKANETKE